MKINKKRLVINKSGKYIAEWMKKQKNNKWLKLKTKVKNIVKENQRGGKKVNNNNKKN